MSHTSGPWEVCGDTTSQLFYIHGSNAICDIRRGGSYSPYCDSRFSRAPREDEANARLIAAAPDLLEACKASLRIADAWMQDTSAGWEDANDNPEYAAARQQADMLREVIRKAEGRK